MKAYRTVPEIVLGNVPKMDIPEVKIRYNRSTRKPIMGVAKTSRDVADFIRHIYKRGEIGLQEQFITLYLNNQNHILGYYRHSIGGMTSTVADIRILLAVALKSASTAMIIAHNHPSGALRPSEADLQLTRKLKEAATMMDIAVLEHIIITQEGYYSFSDHGLMGIPMPNDNQALQFSRAVQAELKAKTPHNKASLEKMAAGFGITDKTTVKELIELSIVREAREIAHSGKSTGECYDAIVDLYLNQVNLSHRTSQSILLQQYSTPAPIGFLAGLFCGIHQFRNDQRGFEPSAGNGLLTIAGSPGSFIVNEIDYTRNRNLQTQGYAAVWNQDASKPFRDHQKQFDAVITNPPFGQLEHPVSFGSFPIKTLDHAMALYALDTMKDEGRAAFITGQHTRWDDKRRVRGGQSRIFLNYLYHHYDVIDRIMIDGSKLYSRQGTSYDVELTLVAGRKKKPDGAAPLYNPSTDRVIKTFEELYERVMDAKTQADHIIHNDLSELEQEALRISGSLEEDELGAPYEPASQSGFRLDTQVPDSMSFEMQSALKRIKEEVGGDMDNFVRHRLGYATKLELINALSAEQIDAVAMAIYNIEAREQGMIIGDQTGIGKGRVAAAMIRYGVKQGLKPIFITEKSNLFSDIYRDLAAIGSAHLNPFIVNAREPKTDIKDEDGNIIYQALSLGEQEVIFKDQHLPARYDFIVATYTQFNSPEKKPEKPAFLMRVAEDNLMIMDEAHNSSGSSNTGEFLQRVVSKTKGVVFLSATFAKRPDNMPIYAMKTAIRESCMSKDELIEAIIRGGVALQEVLSSQLVAEGQMIRRERSFEGVEVNYITLDALKKEHQLIADNITSILRDIIAFQENHIDPVVNDLDDIAAAEGKQIVLRGGTSQAGVDNLPYFSKVFNVINQMLFSIKAEAVADRAIERLKEGKKPVIAFASTMGSFIEQIENEKGLPVSDGDVINADFSEVLVRGLQGVMRYTDRDIDGKASFKHFEVSELSPEGQLIYGRILDRIKSASTGISISPIDVVKQKIESAGYTVAEVTGRKYNVQLGQNGSGLVLSRRKQNTNDAFRQFNNNEIDVLMINQSGSTGASAHAIITSKVPREQVKQRVMIVLQAELNINTEVQKRGRINRTGQIFKPIYDYMISSIPAEKRLMMMLQKKLKSLDANTTSNQRQSARILDVPDFLNKYGDKIVKEYLKENEAINKLLGDPLGFESETKSEETEDAAHKVSGRVAVLSVQMQQEFYDDITERYNDYVEYLKQIDEYDLEVETMNLEAEPVSSSVVKMGKGGESAFGEDSILETVRANVLKKPFTAQELDKMIRETLRNTTPQALQDELINSFRAHSIARLEEEKSRCELHYSELLKGVPNEKKVQRILEKKGRGAWLSAIAEREKEIQAARVAQLAQLEKSAGNKLAYLERIFRFFYTGRSLHYPIQSYTQGQELIPAVCIGVAIDTRKKNPYAPNAVKVRIAIANGHKYIALPASYSADLMAIIGVSNDLPIPDHETLLQQWEKAIRERTSNRSIRHIVTGNLLQAFSMYKGKLVSYTTSEGAVKKGILMPEYWTPDEQKQQGMVVPIMSARKIIVSTVHGNAVHTNNGLSFLHLPAAFKVMVAASKERGGAYYLDKELLALVENNRFELISDKMVAVLPEKELTPFLEVLQRHHNVSMTITREQEGLLEKTKLSRATRAIQLPPQEEAQPEKKTPVINILELEAEALLLTLQLAA